VKHITRSERMAFAALDTRADVFAGATPGPAPDHRAAQHERAFAALTDDDVDDVVVLFGSAIGVAIQQPEAV
jgi:hypothetical protein